MLTLPTRREVCSGPVDPMEPRLHVTVNLASGQRFGHRVTRILFPIDVEEANDWFSIVGRRNALTNSVESKKVVALGQTVSGNRGAHDNRFVVSIHVGRASDRNTKCTKLESVSQGNVNSLTGHSELTRISGSFDCVLELAEGGSWGEVQHRNNSGTAAACDLVMS